MTHPMPSTLVPQAGDDAIADFISSLLNDGVYDPGAHGIHDDYIYAHAKVHTFCTEYQRRTGHAPTPETVMRRHPDFPYVPDAELTWTRQEMLEHTQSRALRTMMNRASRALVDDDPRQAERILTAGLEAMPRSAMFGGDAADTSMYFEDPVAHCPVAGDELMHATGGIAPGNVWYVAGRTGRGKSFELLRHGLAAAESGWNVALFSLEMTKREVRTRLHRNAVGWHPDAKSMAAKVEQRFAEIPGRIDIYTNDGQTDVSITGVRAVAKPNTLILLDYIGLMPHSGMRETNEAIRDLSKELKAIAQIGAGTPIISAAQLNRDGDEGRKSLLEAPPPSLTSVAQSDGLTWDGDLIYFLRGTPGSRVREGRIMKNRHGPDGQRWFIDFQPQYGRYTEIDANQALSLIAEENAQRQF